MNITFLTEYGQEGNYLVRHTIYNADAGDIPRVGEGVTLLDTSDDNVKDKTAFVVKAVMRFYVKQRHDQKAVVFTARYGTACSIHVLVEETS